MRRWPPPPPPGNLQLDHRALPPNPESPMIIDAPSPSPMIEQTDRRKPNRDAFQANFSKPNQPAHEPHKQPDLPYRAQTLAARLTPSTRTLPYNPAYIEHKPSSPTRLTPSTNLILQPGLCRPSEPYSPNTTHITFRTHTPAPCSKLPSAKPRLYPEFLIPHEARQVLEPRSPGAVIPCLKLGGSRNLVSRGPLES